MLPPMGPLNVHRRFGGQVILGEKLYECCRLYTHTHTCGLESAAAAFLGLSATRLLREFYIILSRRYIDHMEFSTADIPWQRI